MKLSRASLLAACVPAVAARVIEPHDAAAHVELHPDGDAAKYLVETAPGETAWVSDEDKWDMKRASLPCRPVPCRPR